MLFRPGLLGRIPCPQDWYFGSGPPTIDSPFNPSSGMPDGWAYTRADNVATDCTYMDGSTITTYTTYNTNQPRLLPFGLLMEPSRTNYFLNSEAPAVANKDITLAVGTYTCWYLGTAATVNILQNTAVIAGGGGGQVRVGIPFTFQVTTAGTVTFFIISGTTRIQVENGPNATSYILSGATPVTRAEERLQQNFFGGQLNQAQGTYWIEWMSAQNARTSGLHSILMTAGIGSYTSSNNTDMIVSDDFVSTQTWAEGHTVIGSNNYGLLLPLAKPPGNVSRIAYSVSLHRNQIAADYILDPRQATDVGARPPSLLAITLGGGGAYDSLNQPMNGYLRGFKYWPVAMPDSELKECTGAGYYRGAPIIDMDFTQGVWPLRRATFNRLATTGVVTDSFYTDAAGSTYNTFPGTGNVGPRFFGNRGLLLECVRANYMPVSNAPITRASVAIPTTTVFCAWMIGTGSITLSNGTGTLGTVVGPLTITAGVVTKFLMATAGTLTVTVTGSVNRVQIEGMGNNPNSWALGPSSFMQNGGVSALGHGAEQLTMPTAKDRKSVV